MAKDEMEAFAFNILPLVQYLPLRFAEESVGLQDIQHTNGNSTSLTAWTTKEIHHSRLAIILRHRGRR